LPIRSIPISWITLMVLIDFQQV